MLPWPPQRRRSIGGDLLRRSGGLGICNVTSGCQEAAVAAMRTLAGSRTFAVHVFHVCRLLQAEVGCYAQPEEAAWCNVRGVLVSLREIGIRADG